MKKALIASIALACVASTTFAAEVKISGWGRGVFSPACTTANEDSEVTLENKAGDTATGWKDSGIGTSADTSWGGSPRIGFGIDGISEFVGFHVDFQSDAAFGGTSALTINDQAKIWVKPVKNVMLQIGRIQEDAGLRGQMGTFGSWNWLRIGSLDQEQMIFQRNDKSQGVTATVTPVEGLVFVGGVEASNNDAIDTYYRGQYGVGYTIANIGQLRAQWIGGNTESYSYAEDLDLDGIPETQDAITSTRSDINVAFRFTAVQNLYADVGVIYCTNIDEVKAKVRGYVKYSMDKLNLHVAGRYDMYDADGFNNVMTVAGGFDYAVMEGVTLEAEARAETVSYEDDAIGMGGLLGISKSLGSGKVGIGVEAASKIGIAGISKGSDEDLSWAIPVTFEFGF